MENEAYIQSYYMSWAFFPCFIVIGIGQILLFYFFNQKFHPFSIILEGANEEGMNISTIILELKQNK